MELMNFIIENFSDFANVAFEDLPDFLQAMVAQVDSFLNGTTDAYVDPSNGTSQDFNG